MATAEWLLDTNVDALRESRFSGLPSFNVRGSVNTSVGETMRVGLRRVGLTVSFTIKRDNAWPSTSCQQTLSILYVYVMSPHFRDTGPRCAKASTFILFVQGMPS